MVVQALMFIFKGLQLRSVPFLPEVMPALLLLVRTCEPQLRDFAFQQVRVPPLCLQGCWSRGGGGIQDMTFDRASIDNDLSVDLPCNALSAAGNPGVNCEATCAPLFGRPLQIDSGLLAPRVTGTDHWSVQWVHLP